MCLERMNKVQTYRVGNTELTQCLSCKGFGLRIGTAYLSFQPTELPGFYHWMLDVRKKEVTRAGDHERVYLQLQSSRVMLALTEGELKDLCSVLEQGLVGATAVGSAAEAPIPFPTSQAVN